MTPPDTRAEMIAKGLSEAQREAVIAYRWDETPVELWHIEPEPNGGKLIPFWCLPNDLGVEVLRECRILASQEADRG